MCGIFAVLASDGGLHARDLDGPMQVLARRGPDGSGRWCSSDGRVALGHTRLAVVDPATGQQPISVDAGAVRMVVSGEFYDYRERRAELERAGRRLVTAGDSEIAAHLYALHGVGFLSRLRGEFAVLLWDERRRELVAARDRFGVKPLFWASHEGRFLFASEVKALFAAGVPARWDSGSFADHLQIAVPADRTLFAGVRQVPPGGVLVVGRSGLRVHRWWDLDYPREDDPEPDVGEHLAAVDAALTDAVTVRSVADVPVGYHLSGGLDSSSVLAIASRTAPRTAFTVRFDDDAFDEGQVARRTAQFLGATLHEIRCGAGDLRDGFVETIRTGETVQENLHGTARLMQSAAIRAHGFRAVQGGEGGDEVFAGYPQFQADLAITSSADARRRAAAAAAGLAAVAPPPHIATLASALGAVPTWVLERFGSVALPLRPLLRPEFAHELAGRDAGADLLAAAGDQLVDRSFLHRSMHLFIRSWFCSYILAAERLDMAHAVEVRLPLLDHQLFETVRSTPVSWYTRAGRTKFPLRVLLAPELPAEVVEGRKLGFLAPPALADDAMLVAVREIVDGPALDANPFFCPQAVRAELARVAAFPPAARRRVEQPVLLVTAVCALAQTFGMAAT